MKTKFLSLLAVGLSLFGCTDDGKELFDSVDSQIDGRISRSSGFDTDTVTAEIIEPMVMTDEIMSLKGDVCKPLYMHPYR